MKAFSFSIFSGIITIVMYFLLFLATFFILPILLLFDVDESEKSICIPFSGISIFLNHFSISCICLTN